MTTPTIADLQAFLDASPSPYHAVAVAARRLLAAGFTEVAETDEWTPLAAGFVRRGGALIAWRASAGVDPLAGVRMVGAHTDSPGLRIKPRPETGFANWRQVGVEVYGGALLNSWLDRDLGLAGRVTTLDGEQHLVAIDEPIARLPQLAIHLDRDVNDKGVLLDKQQHLTPVWGTGDARPGEFTTYLASRLGLDGHRVAAWELQLFDLTPSRLIGADRSLLASGRLDNQVSCWSAISALIAAPDAARISLATLFDHEEVGSSSATGAAGPLLERVLDRLLLARGISGESRFRSLAASSCISADNAHAVHPNYPERHEPGHRPLVNHGPALKLNSNQRYATSSGSAAMFERACTAASVPMQVFVSRNNMPCGSTIGPITATRLGIDTVDVGVPQLSMHSAREVCGVHDPVHLTRALTAYFNEA